MSITRVDVNDPSICNSTSTWGFFLQSYENNNRKRQYVSDVSAFWLQDTTLTSSGCSWCHIPDIESRSIETKNYFMCFR